jgi:hypothetical protein
MVLLDFMEINLLAVSISLLVLIIFVIAVVIHKRQPPAVEEPLPPRVSIAPCPDLEPEDNYKALMEYQAKVTGEKATIMSKSDVDAD